MSRIFTEFLRRPCTKNTGRAFYFYCLGASWGGNNDNINFQCVLFPCYRLGPDDVFVFLCVLAVLAEAYSNSYKNIIKTETISSATTLSVDNNKHSLYQPHLTQLDVGTMSAPSPSPDRILHSPGSPTIHGGLTPLLPSPATSQNPHSSRPRRATLMLTLPDTPRSADSDDSAQAKLSALPMDVLRRVDHLMSIMATRTFTPSHADGVFKPSTPGVRCDKRSGEESAQAVRLLPGMYNPDC